MRYIGIALIFISSLVFGEESTLPIKKVILYKHGVGYFERAGKVKDNKVINLTFKKEQMPDVLKSLVAMDLTGGRILEIEYDSTKPLEKALEDYSINISGDSNLISLLNQIKGAPIDIKVGSELISGAFLGVRKKKTEQEKIIIEQDILDITDAKGGLRSFLLDDIKEITIKETELQKELQDCLNTVFQYRKKQLKRLSIVVTGKGERDVVIGYIVETPVWKTSYRVVLSKEKKPFLQGWAIVDNMSGEDWDNITLSLVSGVPISFIQDLYTPKYKKRPVVELEKTEVQAPVVPEGALYEKRELEESEKARMVCKGLGMAPAAPMAERLRESAEVKTITKEIGDLFEYSIDYPITILKNQSALIPIVGCEVEGERVSLYNENTRPNNPMSSLWLKNTTSLTLEGGPLTVYEDDAYSGEAIINTLKPDEKVFITYAVDLGVSVSTSRDSERRNVHHVSIVNGTLYAYYKEIDIKKYTITNKTTNPKKVIIEHPFRKDWKLIEPKPVEETENYYRFSVDLGPKKTAELIVKEENTFYESYILSNLTPEYIDVFIDKNYITPDLKKTFTKIIEIKTKVNQLERDISNKEGRKEGIFKDQERIRENLKALKDTPTERKLAEEYVNKLTAQEKELEAVQKDIEVLEDEKHKYEQNLDKIISELTFEKDV